MERTLVKETVGKVGDKVILQGWVDTVRDHGKITFIDLRDRSGIVQCVGQGLPKLLPEYVISIVGKVVERPEKLVNLKLETGKVEVSVEELEIISKAQELPFDMGKKTLDLQLPTLLDYRTLTLRHEKERAIFKVQQELFNGFIKAGKDLDCTHIFAPTISASSTEGGSELFTFDYFGNEAFMVQSPQLYKQMMVGVFERVFLFSHIYRAEPSVTTRHLVESIQMDFEIGFINSFEEILGYLEQAFSTIINYAQNECKRELELFGVPPSKVKNEIPRLSMKEAQKIILERTGVDHTKEPDLMPEDERELAAWALEKYDSDLVTVTHFPTKKRAFYSKPDPTDPEYSLSYDLIYKGLEISSGAQRVDNLEELKKIIIDRGMSLEGFKMYLQAFEYGMPPHGGFSYGLERSTMKLLNLENIRQASLFPRDIERVDFLFSSKRKGTKELNDKFVYDQILEKLDEFGVKYQKYEHEPVYTSEQAAKIRKTDIHQGAKALVLQADKDFILFVTPADIKADLEKLQSELKVKKLRMASKESVLAKTGLEVGAVPPLGSTVGLKTYADSRLADNDEVAFNAGRHDRSIKMKYSDFVKIEKPQIIILVK